MTWAEALEVLKQGKRVRRAIWFAGLTLRVMRSDKGERELCFLDGDSLDSLCFLAIEDLEATDWELC